MLQAALPTIAPAGMYGVYIVDEAERKPRRYIKKCPPRQILPTCANNVCTSPNVINGKIDPDSGKVGSGCHTKGKKVFSCKTCGLVWQQIPPELRTPGDNGPEISICKKRALNKDQGYKCGRCGQQKKIGGKSHVCSNPKERKDKQEKAPTEKEINKDLQDVVLQNFPFPGVYTVDQFANIDGANNDKPLEDIATCPDDKCVICNKTGTHAAGNETSFLECHVCNKVVIHYSCLEEFTMEWTCASCNGD